MSDISLQPLGHPFSAEFTPPGSKSLTNRALVLSVLAYGNSKLSNVLLAEDTQVMLESLRRLGFELDLDEPNLTISVKGSGGDIPASSAELFCGNSGTSIRFLAALCALGRGQFVLDGIPRMRQRPIGELAKMLQDLGVRSNYLAEPGFPPLQIHADGFPGGLAKFGAAQSSQFLSAILMVCPYARNEVHIDLIDRQTSWPYVAMTLQLMDHFGVTPELVRDPRTQEPKMIVIPRDHYRATDYTIEPDASSASYFLALAAIHPGSKITLHGLGKHSLQGDVGFADVLHRMGAGLIFGKDFITIMGMNELRGIEVDLSTMPDTAQTLAVVALFARGPTTIHGLQTLRVKETDRLEALRTELSRLGAEVEIDADTLHIEPPRKLRSGGIATYDDHRMAMSFALAATKSPGIVITESQCVNKTYPGFFADLQKVMGG